MTALVELVVVVAWTLLLLRVVGIGATLSEHTFGIYFVLGALLAMAAAPPMASLVSPYAEPPAGLTLLLLTLGRLGLVLAPVLYALRSEQTRRSLSVADAFLLAFMVGFGFDLLGMLVAAGTTSQSLHGLVFLPPWQFQTDRLVVAGFGYWAGLVALTGAAARRFIRQADVARIVTLVVFVLVCLQATAAATIDRPTGSLASLLGTAFDHLPTAWIALLALLALSAWEAVWVARAGPGPAGATNGRELLPIAEWKARFGALAHADFGEYAEASAFFGRLRQARLADTEAAQTAPSATPPPAAAPSYPPPAAVSPTAPLRPPIPVPPGASPPRRPPASHDDDRPTPPPTPRPIMGGSLDVVGSGGVPRGSTPWAWQSPVVVQAALAVALLVVVGLLPQLPTALAAAIWAFPLWSFELHQPALTILNAVLVVALLAWYVLAAGRPHRSDADDRVRFAGEQAILQAALASAVLVLLGVRNNYLYPFYSVFALHAGIRFPQLEVSQAQTLLLLLAAAAASLTLGRAAAWKRAPLAERRASAVHNAITVLMVLSVSWVIVAFYLPTLTAMHEHVGALMFDVFGQGGNVIGGYVMIAFSALLSWLTLRVARPVAARVEAFLVDDADAGVA